MCVDGVGIDQARGFLAERRAEGFEERRFRFFSYVEADVRLAFISAGTASGAGLIACTRCRIFKWSTTAP
jgi:hypothetical protein